MLDDCGRCFCFCVRCVCCHFAYHCTTPATAIICYHISGIFTSKPPSTNEVLYVCDGSRLSITCSHNNTNIGVTRWTFSNFSACENGIVIRHSDPRDTSCGPIMFHGISRQTQPMLKSTASVIASPLLNGTVVECLDRAGIDPDVIGNTAIVVIGEYIII